MINFPNMWDLPGKLLGVLQSLNFDGSLRGSQYSLPFIFDQPGLAVSKKSGTNESLNERPRK